MQALHVEHPVHQEVGHHAGNVHVLGLHQLQPGLLDHRAQQVAVVMLYPWLLWPGAFVILTVLAFNFLGDGLRDAADPYR